MVRSRGRESKNRVRLSLTTAERSRRRKARHPPFTLSWWGSSSAIVRPASAVARPGDQERRSGDVRRRGRSGSGSLLRRCDRGSAVPGGRASAVGTLVPVVNPSPCQPTFLHPLYFWEGAEERRSLFLGDATLVDKFGGSNGALFGRVALGCALCTTYLFFLFSR